MCWNLHVSKINLLEPKAHLFSTASRGFGTVFDAQERHNICFTGGEGGEGTATSFILGLSQW